MKKIISLILCLSLCAGMGLLFSGCGKSEAPDAFVIMSEELDGLFNPFFSTSGADNTIVSMTQIGMLGSTYENGEIGVAFGDNEAVVTKDFEYRHDPIADETTYTFVIKNGIKFSDGHTLTIEDVLFNIYLYLDPVYTGSSTIYSTDIKGLVAYRTQKIGADSDSNDDDRISSTALSRAKARRQELINIFNQLKKKNPNEAITYEMMVEAIGNTNPSSGYKNAIAVNGAGVTNEQLLADYEKALKLFKEELGRDYTSAKEAFTEAPYKDWAEFQDEVFCFMFSEGYVKVEYEKYYNDNGDYVDNKNKIKTLTPEYNTAIVNNKDAAINFVYQDNITGKLDVVLLYWATANELLTDFTAKATEVVLKENMKSDGSLAVDHISGIVSLGHQAATKGSTITVNGNEYKVASSHNEDGTPAGDGEYDVLQITIDGVDPKAVWNFAFTVAPQHYYGEGSSVAVDIENNKFGVEYGTYSFMTDIVQSTRNIKIPMGAGAYKATNSANSDTPSTTDFYKDNVVYFKANNYFETVGADINNAKIEKIRFQVVSSNNALNALSNGSVHYVTPQLTQQNYEIIDSLEAKGMVSLLADQLGYGYIGINAAKVEDINLRKAIMCAMDTSLAIDYYRAGTASQIYWPMSKVSWAYPKDDSGNYSTDNDHDYPQIGAFDKSAAIDAIKGYMAAAGVTAGDDDLKITFTIAGSNLQEHPAYAVFRDAAVILNDLGWNITVVPDTQALTKINTGDLAVWAAAWGSTIDPDMYQVYHKNSTATSTTAWGYDAILSNSSRVEEQNILAALSDLIDDARETENQATRTALYEEAMKLVLDLAVELPVYQRSTVYVYNANVINSDTMPKASEMNPYTSPLDRIWEIEFAN